MTSVSGSHATYCEFRDALEEDCANVQTGGRGLGEASGKRAETNIVVMNEVMLCVVENPSDFESVGSELARSLLHSSALAD